MNKYRTHNCLDLRVSDINKNVILSGWITEKEIMEIYYL